MPPKIGYLEIPAVEPERAAEFFASVFGWSPDFRSWSGGTYCALGDAAGAVGCGLVARAEVGLDGPTPVVHVENAELDEYLEKVVTAGGEVLGPPRLIDDLGRFGRFRDSEGNVWGLWAPADPPSQS